MLGLPRAGEIIAFFRLENPYTTKLKFGSLIAGRSISSEKIRRNGR